jgi:hypothetical protein
MMKLVLVLGFLFVLGVTSYPLDTGIDGNPHFWWGPNDILRRQQLAAPVTRMFFDPKKPITFMDKHVMLAVRDVRTRVHALIGVNRPDGVSSTAYAAYALQVVQRFGRGGAFWRENPGLNQAYAVTTVELMNEPYIGKGANPIAYAKYITRALKTLKGKGVQVIVASRNYASSKGSKWFLALYKVIPKLNSYIAGFATHPYYNGHSPNQKKFNQKRPFSSLDSLRKMMNCKGAKNKGIFITEYGGSTAPNAPKKEGVSEAAQAAHLKAFFQAVVSNKYGWNVKMMLAYTLLDYPMDVGGADPANREAHFGLIYPDGNTPKPAYWAVKPFMRKINVNYRRAQKSSIGTKIIASCK